MADHLKDNSVKLADTKCRVGKTLKFDAVSERFVDDAKANEMLTRPERAPFIVPAKVV